MHQPQGCGVEGLSAVLAAQRQPHGLALFGLPQQLGHGACVQRGPGAGPGTPVFLQGGGAQGICHLRRLRGRCQIRGQCPGAVHPERVDCWQALGRAGVVEGVGVEQHLHFALQAVQGTGLARVWHPGAHVAALHAFKRGSGQRSKQGAAGQPAGGLVVVQGDAVLGKPRSHDGEQFTRGGFVQAQVGRVVQGDVIIILNMTCQLWKLKNLLNKKVL